MSQVDWIELTNSLSGPSAVRAVTAGTTPPNGGSVFVHGCNTLVNTTGVVGKFLNQASFTPMAKGGDIRGAMKRGLSSGNTGFSCFLWILSTGDQVADSAYMLGLGDSNPAHIVLRKGSFANGLIDGAPGTSGVLARSNETIAIDEWVHLRLEAVVNVSGDVVLNVYRNDLDLNPVTAPIWDPIPGMSDFPNGIEETAFIDDALGVNSGSVPFTSGRVGVARHMAAQSRRTYFDHIEIARQL